jgi:hypothetical protein
MTGALGVAQAMVQFELPPPCRKAPCRALPDPEDWRWAADLVDGGPVSLTHLKEEASHDKHR